MLLKHKHKSPKIFNYTNECNYAGMQGSQVHRTAVSQAKHFRLCCTQKTSSESLYLHLRWTFLEFK